MDERSYKQRLVTRCDEIIGGGGRRLGQNSVAPPIPLVGARARYLQGKRACGAHAWRRLCREPRRATTESRYVIAVIRLSSRRHRMLLPRFPLRWHKIARGRALDA